MEWFDRYRAQTVRHILTQSKVGTSDECLELCRDRPILAVFFSYLYSCDRTADLTALATEKSFGRWILKRVQLSFTSRSIEKELAMLIAQFPLDADAVDAIYRSPYQPLFNNLASDGWIESDPAQLQLNNEQVWVTPHDVFADQIVVQYLESIPNTAELFIDELLDFSIQVGGLRSTLYTLQRLVGTPQIDQLDWFSIFTKPGETCATF